MLKLIPIKYQIYFYPFLTFLVIFFSSLFLVRGFLEHINSIREEIGTLKTDNNTLGAKKNFLSGLDKQKIAKDAQLAILAIPSEDSTLPAIATVRTLAAKRGLSVTNIQIKSAGEVNGANGVEITISVAGNLDSIMTYIEDLKKSAPLMVLGVENISLDPNVSLTNISVTSPWAPLPKNIGSIQSPLTPLRDTDEELIRNLEQLAKLNIVGQSVPATGRENPFSF